MITEAILIILLGNGNGGYAVSAEAHFNTIYACETAMNTLVIDYKAMHVPYIMHCVLIGNEHE